jgi:hypothetical protein
MLALLMIGDFRKPGCEVAPVAVAEQVFNNPHVVPNF